MDPSPASISDSYANEPLEGFIPINVSVELTLSPTLAYSHIQHAIKRHLRIVVQKAVQPPSNVLPRTEF